MVIFEAATKVLFFIRLVNFTVIFSFIQKTGGILSPACHTASDSRRTVIRRHPNKRMCKDLIHLYAALLIVLKHSYEQVLEFRTPFCIERHLVCRVIRFYLIFRQQFSSTYVLRESIRILRTLILSCLIVVPGNVARKHIIKQNA